MFTVLPLDSGQCLFGLQVHIFVETPIGRNGCWNFLWVQSLSPVPSPVPQSSPESSPPNRDSHEGQWRRNTCTSAILISQPALYALGHTYSIIGYHTRFTVNITVVATHTGETVWKYSKSSWSLPYEDNATWIFILSSDQRWLAK